MSQFCDEKLRNFYVLSYSFCIPSVGIHSPGVVDIMDAILDMEEERADKLSTPYTSVTDTSADDQIVEDDEGHDDSEIDDSSSDVTSISSDGNIAFSCFCLFLKHIHLS